jgi:hypothetical protein
MKFPFSTAFSLVEGIIYVKLCHHYLVAMFGTLLSSKITLGGTYVSLQPD